MSTLSEQVAELERERDTLVVRFDGLRESLRQSQERVHTLVEERETAIIRAEAAESRLAAGKAEGAREALGRLAAQTWAQVRPFPHDTSFDEMVLRFRDREYPAVPEGGEQARCKWDDVPCGGEECRATCHAQPLWSCDKCGQSGETREGCALGECGKVYASRPTPTPEREGYEGPIVALSLTEMSDGGEKLLITPALASRIVSLAAQDGGRNG